MSLDDLLVRSDGPRWEGRRPRGVPLVHVMARSDAAEVRPVSGGVIVSIRSPGALQVRLSPRWKAVLPLEIQDVDPHGQLNPAVDLRPSAEAIARFVTRFRQAPQIVLHCHAGLSRSRSVAAAICEEFGWPYHWTVLHKPLYESVRLALRGEAGL